MQIEYGAEMKLAFDDEMPLETQQELLEQMQADQRTRAQRVAEISREISALKEAYRSDLHERFGAERYGAFRSYVRDARASLAAQLEPPGGLTVTSAAYDTLQAERRAAGDAYLREIGIDAAELRAANVRLRERTRALMEAVNVPHRSTGEIVLPENVPADILAGKANPYTILKPGDFTAGSTSYPSSVDDFTLVPTTYMNLDANLVGSSNYLKNSSAGDFDFAWVVIESSLGISYKMPATGLVEIWIEAQCADNHHHLTLSDEWWWSDASDDQYAYLATQTLGPGGGEWRYVLLSEFHADGTDGYWNRHNLINGKTYWAHTFSDASYAKDKWVYVWVGSHNDQRAFCNDVSLYGDIRFKWFFKSVWIDSTG
jgi:hypothetical protein